MTYFILTEITTLPLQKVDSVFKIKLQTDH